MASYTELAPKSYKSLQLGLHTIVVETLAATVFQFTKIPFTTPKQIF